MQRIQSDPRHDWQKTVESQGFVFHTPDGESYWNESACYQFSAAEADAVEKATYALNDLCLKAVQHVIDARLYEKFQIAPAFIPLVEQSWDRDETTIYGRFDLAFDGKSPPKLIEYNADTPTSLVEAAVIQWYWMKDTHGNADQFNSIHERLIEAWKRVAAENCSVIHFTCYPGNIEDWMTLSYLRDTALQAGLKTVQIDIDRVGFNHARGQFVDESERLISRIFKLYPWEWMLREKFAPHLLQTTTRWLEAPWKMILSNKAILPVLWELFPESPYLLPASFESIAGPQVRKPIFGREGVNVRIVDESGNVIESTEGQGADLPDVYNGPYVHQQLSPLPCFDGRYALLGSWMVNGWACGMGVREDENPIIHGGSRFVPHILA